MQGKMDPRTICQKLCDRCEVSSDNVTVILLQFKNAPPPPAPEEDNAANNGDNAGPPADAGNNRDNAAPPAPEETPLLRDDAITEAWWSRQSFWVPWQEKKGPGICRFR